LGAQLCCQRSERLDLALCDRRYTAAAEARPDQLVCGGGASCDAHCIPVGRLVELGLKSALVKVHDIATNKPLNMRSWQDVREVVDKAREEARRNDRAERRHSPK